MRMRGRRARSLLVLFAAAGSCVGFRQQAQGTTFNVSWVGVATGGYNTAANWSGGVVPNNGSPVNGFYNVTINRAGGAVVTGNLGAEIMNLTIGSGNTLDLSNNIVLDLIGSATNGPCTFTNSGTIALTATTGAATLNLLGSTTNLSGGTVILTNGTVTGTGTVTFSSDFEGSGSVGANALAMINSGGRFEALGGFLDIDPRFQGGLQNDNTLSLHSNTGTIQLNGNAGGSFNNSSGTISVVAGEIDLINGATIAGGTLLSNNASVLLVPAGHMGSLNGCTLSGSGLDARAAQGGTLALNGTITNNSRMIIAGSTTGTGTASIVVGGINQTMTFNGTGSMMFGQQ